MTHTISRCTQNASFMEEWRKGWHPERSAVRGSANKVLVVGAGPTGLSAAHRLGLRGYEVVLAEGSSTLGGRVALESKLPGLAAWNRVTDYRVGQIQKMSNVTIYRESMLAADDVLDFGFAHIAIATGAKWRNDGVARFHTLPIPIDAAMPIYTPDDIMAGRMPATGHVVLYDDDHYYMGSVLAERLVALGCRVTYLTPSAKVSEWSFNTLEQGFIQARLLNLDISIQTNHAVSGILPGAVEAVCTYTGRKAEIACDGVVLVTARKPRNDIYQGLKAAEASWAENGILSVRVIGDAEAPAAIAWATYAGQRYAEELDAPDLGDALPFRREVAGIKD
jgi:dimethylamine/trimethylamine dehydrogenase